MPGADAATRALLAAVDDPALRAETEAERGFLRALGGGCSAPVGAFAQSKGGRLHLHGRISALDGTRVVDVEGEGDDPAALVAVARRTGVGRGGSGADRGGGSARHSRPRGARARSPGERPLPRARCVACACW